MILINKNATTRNILTLSEKTKLTNAVYLFKVTNDTTNAVKCFIAKDIALNPLRCNEFDLIENTTENLLIGKFTLNTGFHTYKVYEQASTTNLDPTGLTEIDNGKLKVVESITPNLEYNSISSPDIVYQ